MDNQHLLDLITKDFPLTEEDSGEFKKFKVSPMTFTVRSFDAKGLGHVCLMEGKAMMGLMVMDTLVITPTDKDAPIFSYDRIHAMGNDRVFLELYATVCGTSFDETDIKNVKQSYSDVQEKIPEDTWYKHLLSENSFYPIGKKKDSTRFDDITVHYLKEVLSSMIQCDPCDKEAKNNKNKAYADGLIKNGGASTNVFKKKLGEKKTQEFFDSYFFGTQK